MLDLFKKYLDLLLNKYAFLYLLSNNDKKKSLYFKNIFLFSYKPKRFILTYFIGTLVKPTNFIK